METAETVFHAPQKKCTVERPTLYNYLPGHGDILRLQRHSKIAEISVHYHNIKGGERGDMRSIVRVF
jgi:hypothetical protein